MSQRPRPVCRLTIQALLAATFLLVALPVAAIVVRDDRDDARYLELGSRYPAAAKILPDGSGVLIAPDWVLTAAHVARGVAQRSPRVEIDDRVFAVTRVVVHEGWRDRGAHDIALLQLDRPVEGVKPAALHASRDEVGRVITFVGTGDTGTGLTGPHTMDGKKRGATNTVESADEDWIYFTFDRGDEATDLEGVSGPGDSGGPALLERDGRLFTLGVSVFSKGGGKGPGRYGIREGYTRVSTHVDWIRAVLAGEKAEREIAIGDRGKRATGRRGPGGDGRAVVVGGGSQEIPDTPFGAVVRGYVETYNRDDDAAMWEFIRSHFQDDVVARKTEQEHLGLYRRLFDELFGKVTLRAVVGDDASGLTLLLDSARGKTAEFRFEAGEENKIGGMKIAIVEVSRD